MSVDVSLKIKTADVLRLGSRVGVGRKVVVVEKDVDTRHRVVTISYLNLIDHGRLLSEAKGWTTYRLEEPVEKLGRWDGNLWSGSRGKIQYNPGLEPGEGEANLMATKTKGAAAKKGTAKKGATKAKSNGGESKRASNEELDALAAQVVDLRDNEEKSWGEIQEELDIEPSRLRSLYNRGGGEPTRKRQGSAKAKAEAKSKGKTKGKRTKTRKEDPSDED